jgi:hypothetical protein
MRTRRTSAAASLLLTGLLAGVSGGVAVGLAGCGGSGGGLNIQPSSIVVQARAQGLNGLEHTAPDSILTLQHDSSAQRPRVALGFADIFKLQHLKLTATSSTGLPFPEEWHSLVIFHQTSQPGSSDPVPVVSSDERSFVENNRGNIAWLVIRHSDLTLPSDTFSNFTGIPAGGVFVLARKEDADPAMPWTRNDSPDALSVMPLSASLRPLAPAGGSDCFDMQSFTSAIFNQIALAVEDRIQDFNNSPNLIESLIDVHVGEHRIYLIPHVTEGNFPGFGFIYEASLTANVVGLTGAHLTVSIPITFHWMRDSLSQRFTMNIDPLGPTLPGTELANVRRIAVSTTNGDLSEGFLNQLRTKITAGITGMSMPTGPAGLSFDGLLTAAFADFFLGTSGTLPQNFSVLALPENQAVSGTPTNLIMNMAALTVADTTVTPGRPGGMGADTVALDSAGRAVVLRNKNAAGTAVRSFRFPAPNEMLPIKLFLLQK